MADWVHCNRCFLQPGDGKKFCLTNCGHIFCESCAKPGSQITCSMCSVKCTTILLSSKMKPDIEMFFTDPVDLKKKQDRQLLKVLEFQKNHRKRLTVYNQQHLIKQKNTISKAQNTCAHQFEEIKCLKEEILYLKKMLKSDGMGRCGSPADNMRQLSPSEVSPRLNNRLMSKRSPLNSANPQHGMKPPFSRSSSSISRKTPPMVTSGRVLVSNISPRYTKIHSTSISPQNLGNPSPYSGVHAPIPPNITMPITPLVSKSTHAYKSPISSPMELDRGDHRVSGRDYHQIQMPTYNRR